MKVSMVAVVCILMITIVSKNVIHAEMDFIFQYTPYGYLLPSYSP